MLGVDDGSGRRVLPCTGNAHRTYWERILLLASKSDGTLVVLTALPSTEIESGYIMSLNLQSAAKFQQESVKMFALIPAHDKDAAAQAQQRNEKGGCHCTKPGLV